jgi:ABC-2 type transport system permease protein
MRRVVAIAGVELTRLLRDRSNIFFVFVFPLLLVVLIGAQFGGSVELRVGVVAPSGDEAAEALIADIDATDSLEVVAVEDAEVLRDDVTRGLISAGVVVPEGFDEAVSSVTPVEVAFVGRPDASATSIRTVVQALVAERAAAGDAATLAAGQLDTDPAELRELADELAGEIPGIEVGTETVGTDELGEEFAGLGQFDLGASSQLFLFTFLTSLAGGSALIQTRRYGVAHRMLASPTPMRGIVAGLAGGRLLVALMQAGYIVVATVLLFRVNWGDPLATTAVIGLFCVVAAAAGLLLGATLRNDSQAGGAGIGLGLGLAALGGSMVPLELFPEGIRVVSRFTPHAWANEAMAEIVRRDGTITDVLPQIGVLGAFAAVLVTLGTWRLQRTLSGG